MSGALRTASSTSGGAAWLAQGRRPNHYVMALALSGAALVFAYVTLSVRRFYHGADISDWKGFLQSELYTYSVVWLLLGVALLVIFGGQLQWFPLRGLTSANWEQLAWGARITDYLWHIALPVTAMVFGSFAVTAMLTKNAFLEEIRKQYVLTARAKGLSEKRVLWKHVLRNALIPIITGFPAAFIGAFFTGSLLIETLFSLDGLGLLSYESVIRRDYPVVLGTLYLFTLLGLVTKLVSDLCYVLVDPRVKFD